MIERNRPMCLYVGDLHRVPAVSVLEPWWGAGRLAFDVERLADPNAKADPFWATCEAVWDKSVPLEDQPAWVREGGWDLCFTVRCYEPARYWIRLRGPARIDGGSHFCEFHKPQRIDV